MKKRQLCDRGFRRNPSLQAAWDTSTARTINTSKYGFCLTSSRTSVLIEGGKILRSILLWNSVNECINLWLWICMLPYMIRYIYGTCVRPRIERRKLRHEYRPIHIQPSDRPSTLLRPKTVYIYISRSQHNQR